MNDRTPLVIGVTAVAVLASCFAAGYALAAFAFDRLTRPKT